MSNSTSMEPPVTPTPLDIGLRTGGVDRDQFAADGAIPLIEPQSLGIRAHTHATNRRVSIEFQQL